jgi:hypothetical protein
MRPYETHPFSRPTDLIIINRPLLTNFGLLRARFFSLHALYTFLFNFNFCAALFRALFVLSLPPFLPVSQLFREQVLRAQPYVQLFFQLFFQLFLVSFPLVQSPAAIFYLPPYVVVNVLSLPARLHVLAPE